jgi:hypothetical protein
MSMAMARRLGRLRVIASSTIQPASHRQRTRGAENEATDVIDTVQDDLLLLL